MSQQPSVDSPSDRHARVKRLYMAMGVIWTGCVRVYWLIFFVRVVVDLDLDPLQLVLLGTAKEVAVLVSEIPTGAVADLHSRKRSIMLAFLISGGAIALAGVANSFGVLVIAAALWGFGLTFRSGAEAAWLTDELGSADLSEPVILRRARFEFGAAIVGIGVAAFLAQWVSLGVLLVVAGGLLVAAGLVFSFLLPETGFTPATRDRGAEFRSLISEGFAATRRPGPLRILAIATVFAGFGSEAIDRLYVRRLDDLGFDDAGDGTTLVAGIVIGQMVVASLMLWRTRDRLAGQVVATALTASFAFTAMAALALARVDSLVIATIGLLVQGAARAIAEPLRTAWTNAHTAPRSRATVLSFVGQAHSLGEISGGVVLGTIARLVDIPMAITGSALLYVAAALVQRRATAEGRTVSGAAKG